MKILRSKDRFIAHNYEVICALYGSLLGDCYAEKRSNSTRFVLQQESSNMEYLMWYHSFFAERGYMPNGKPKMQTRIGKNSKIRFFYRVRTWSFASLNWVFESFYPNGKKIVPLNLEEFFSPLTIAIWIQEDGGSVSSGLKIATNNFTLDEVLFLCELFWTKFGILASPNKAGVENQWVIYIKKQSMPKLVLLVKDYIVPSMFYKFNNYLPIVTNK
jgi:hypothetical protein